MDSYLILSFPYEGRVFSLQFYYGRVIGAIHDVLVRRETFTRCPDDADKINTYIAHRGANHPEVVAFRTADDQQKDIERNATLMCQAFDREYREVTPKGSIKPPWMTESTHRVLQLQPLVARSRLGVEERDRSYTIAKGDFCRYYHYTHQHTIIDMRFHWLKDCIQRKQFHVEHVAGRDNIAEFFTKALPWIKHQQFAPLCAMDPVNP
jgi:hypothetical protein